MPEGATKFTALDPIGLLSPACHRSVHRKRKPGLDVPVNLSCQKQTQTQRVLSILCQMSKERNKGNILLKIRMSHAVQLASLKLQTKA